MKSAYGSSEWSAVTNDAAAIPATPSAYAASSITPCRARHGQRRKIA